MFKDIKGQDGAISVIQASLKQGRLAASYLFCGPEGVGKKLTALTLAKAANCLSATFDSCDSCDSCRKIEQLRHPDVLLLGCAENESIKIEQVRQLQKEVSLRAYEGRKKAVIIDNAHNLTPEAANALLKTLEEPAANSLIILISDKPNLLFKTIISRCQTVKFRSFARQDLQDILINDYGLDKEQAHFLAYFCEGRLAQALRLKDAGLLADKNRVLDDFLFYGRRSSYAAPQDRQDLKRQLNVLAGALRDIYLIKTKAAENGLINLDRERELSGLAPRYTFTQLNEALDFVSDALLYAEQNINVKLLLANLRAELCKDRS